MILKTTFTLFSLLILSCGSVQNTSDGGESDIAAKVEAEKMMAEGFLPGRIIFSELADDCDYTIQLKDGKREFYYVDPINLKEGFKEDEKTIWVKFTALRRMNRCENAIPVEITSIQNRTE